MTLGCRLHRLSESRHAGIDSSSVEYLNCSARVIQTRHNTDARVTMTDVMASPCGTPAEALIADPRIAWANSIRKIVTRPDALNDDGSLNQQFFKPKRVVFATEKAKWNDEDKENLYKGIEKFGIDPSSWKKIIEEFCPGRDVLFIRIKASRLIGSQGLNRYHGWIGTKDEVIAEYERNKAIGLATGCWKGGILVENDHGDAMKAIRERDEKETADGIAPPGKRTKHN